LGFTLALDLAVTVFALSRKKDLPFNIPKHFNLNW
jgi:hypothetical protein